ncbi:hypothetical protein [Embleya sp. NPDC020630]|uniref:hypothetical protein n=1 Tax=Embleya sp. NPDC020630 TaxID=3363979 RepID=UPI00379C8DA2
MVSAMHPAASVANLAEQEEMHACGRRGALADALAPFEQRRVVGELLRTILASESGLAAVAAKSYRHPNGFSKVVLASGPHHQLRLHIWWMREATRHDTANVHNHRWDFSSLLLTGGYRYQQFVPLDPVMSAAVAPGAGPGIEPEAERASEPGFERGPEPGQPFHAYAYHSADDSSSYSLIPRGTRRLLCVFDADLAAGTKYELSADVLHRVLGDPSRTTASLVLQGRDRRASVDVFARSSLRAGPAIALTPFSPRCLARQLTFLLKHLEGVEFSEDASC